jgi:streptogrisin B
MMGSRRVTVSILTAAVLLLAPMPAYAAELAPSAGQAMLAVERLAISGTSWHEENGSVVVTADETVSGAEVAGLKKALGRNGKVVRAHGELTTLIAGGQAIYSGGARCSLGANARRGSTYYFITAGHCTNAGTTWYGNSGLTTVLGKRAGTSFPGNDYGLVAYTNAAIPHPSAVYTYPGLLPIYGPGTPVVGITVCRSGSTTGVRCGVITALNATVNYAEGVVYGLIRTNICAEPGDSGGPLYIAATGRVIGILSGGSGNCTSGGVSYYQPIMEILSAYGLTIP